MKPTDAGEFLHSLNAGVFAQQIGHALSEVAAGVVDHSKVGKVVITLNMKQIGESSQVNISHKLDYVVPTKRGSRSENTKLDTPMHVTPNGLELFPTDPTAQMFSKDEAPVTPR